jgi:hypothetical protein
MLIIVHQDLHIAILKPHIARCVVNAPLISTPAAAITAATWRTVNIKSRSSLKGAEFGNGASTFTAVCVWRGGEGRGYSEAGNRAEPLDIRPKLDLERGLQTEPSWFGQKVCNMFQVTFLRRDVANKEKKVFS